MERVVTPPDSRASMIRDHATRVFVAALLVGMLLAIVPVANIGGDFICFWTAGRLVSQGQDPYDPVLQTELQTPLGWDKSSDGLGVYAFMPFYYPPWFAVLCVPFGLLGFSVGKVVWLFAITWLLLASGDLMARSIDGMRKSIPVLTVSLFALSVLSILFGQTTSLILFLIAVCWWGISVGRDALAGAALAWLTIKPQLTAILIVAALLWAAREHRWRVVFGFAAMLSTLVILSLVLLPGWPRSFWFATRRTPLITEFFPWLGSTWYLVLKVSGVRGIWLTVGYLVGAIPIVALTFRSAWRSKGQWESVLGLSLLSVFFVSPYCQPYDFVVLLPTFLILVAQRLPERSGALLLLSVMVLPYLHIAFGQQLRLWWLDTALPHRVTFFWLPVLLAVSWSSTLNRKTGTQSRESLEISAPALQ